MNFRQWFLLSALLLLLATFLAGHFIHPDFYLFYILIGPLFLMGIADILQKKQSIRRNFPLFGRLRYVLEDLRPKIQQYFVESDTDGTPINRIERSVVYQRAKKQIDTTPFGTQLNVYAEGYEWMTHSITPKDFHTLNHHPKIKIGGAACTLPYESSILNISAMSFGSLSKNAILALNGGAKLGGFAHNTGEGGLSPYHLQPGGDIIWQIGTGYFGARDKEGNFNDDAFQQNAIRPEVKMIEVKLSQGAKPGHGGILPAKKNTPNRSRLSSPNKFPTMKTNILLLALGFGLMLLACGARAGALDQLSNADAASGLKKALDLGINAAVDKLGVADGFFGKTAILAARIASQARGGEIVACGTLAAYALARFQFRGSRALYLFFISGMMMLKPFEKLGGYMVHTQSMHRKSGMQTVWRK